MEIKISQKLSQSLVMTPQLQQAIKLLQLSRLELIDLVREEMMQNPILEEQAEAGEDRGAAGVGAGEPPAIDDRAAMEERGENRPSNPEEQRAAEQSKTEEYWERFLEAYANQAPLPSGVSRSGGDELPSLEQTLSTPPSLADHLEEQLRLTNLSEAEFRFALMVINNLDDNGYLNLRTVTPPAKPPATEAAKVGEAAEIESLPANDGADGAQGAMQLDGGAVGIVALAEVPIESERLSQTPASRTLTIEDLAREADLDPEDAEEVLHIIQSLDPVGVAARDLRECLLVQAEAWGYDRDTTLWQLIDRHLHNLERRNFGAIAKDLHCEIEDVYDAARTVATLEPRPGRNFAALDHIYITPDVFVSKVGEEYVVSTNDDGMPRLRVNTEQARSLMRDPKAKQFVQDKLQSAKWFVRSLDQRQRTIVRVTQCIVEKQREFFERGIEHLKPMILRDVADAVGMHESTISRVTTNKWVHTPRGIFELKYFFNSSIKRVGSSEDIASEAVKQAIKKIISEEDPKNPLSDELIVKRLESGGVMIARRTVAKYRDVLGILPSAKRKQYF